MYFNSGSAYHDADRRCFFFLKAVKELHIDIGNGRL